MNRLLRALTVLSVLTAAVLLVAVADQHPGKLTLVYGTHSFEITLAVAAAMLALLMGVAFYLGQLLTWLGRLPGQLQNMLSSHKRSTAELLAEAHAAQFLGLTRDATRAVSRTSPTAAEEALVNLLNIRLGTTPATTLARWQPEALLGAPASLELARRAAMSADWPAVKASTAQGLALSPQSPRLLFLHLKALLNTNETAAALDLFPALRPHLTSGTAKKLEILLKGQLTPDITAAGLRSPWYTAFQQWLTNAAEQLPEA